MSENDSSRMPESQDQISFVDVLIIILKYKWLIVTIMVAAIIISIFYTYKSNISNKPESTVASVNQSENKAAPALQDTIDVYYSRCVIEANTNIIGTVKALLMSHRITESISRNAKLNNINYKTLDDKTQQDLQNLEYNQAGGIPAFLKNKENPNKIRPTLTLNSQNNILEIGFFINDADIPQKFLNDYLYQLSDYLRKQNIEKIDLQKKAVQSMLRNARDPIIKENYKSNISIKTDRTTASIKQSKNKAATAPQDIVYVYYSRCIIEIKNNLISKFKALLMSDRLAESILRNAKLYKINYETLDEKTQQDLQKLEYNKAGVIPDFLINEKNPHEIRPTLTLYSQKNILEIGFFINDADIPQKILNDYLYQLSDYLRKQNIEKIDLQKKAVQRMMENARDPILKENLYLDLVSLNKQEMEVINSKLYGFYVIDPPIATKKMSVTNEPKPIYMPDDQIKNLYLDLVSLNKQEMEVKNSKLYGFYVIDPPIATKKMSITNEPKPIDKSAGQISAEGQERMKKRKIVIPVIIMSFFLAVMLAFLIEYLKNMKMNNPEKFQILRNYARFRIK